MKVVKIPKVIKSPKSCRTRKCGSACTSWETLEYKGQKIAA